MRKAKITFLLFMFSFLISFPCFSMNVIEDFSQDYGGFGCPGYYWGMDNDDAWIENGRLIIYAETNYDFYYWAWIDCSDTGTYTYYPAPGTSDYFDEFSASIDTYWLDGGANRHGIYVCLQGNDSAVDGIWFWLWGDTYYTINKTIDWTYEEIVPWTTSNF